MDSVAVAIVGFIGAFLIFAIAWYILQVIAHWKIFIKAGIPGWKALIPLYNTYLEYQMTWSVNAFFSMLILSAIALVLRMFNPQDDPNMILSAVISIVQLAVSFITIMQIHKLSKSFGHGAAFTIGLVLLNPIFKLILGFSNDEYQGPQ